MDTILFINLNPPYNLDAATVALAAQATTEIVQQMVVVAVPDPPDPSNDPTLSLLSRATETETNDSSSPPNTDPPVDTTTPAPDAKIKIRKLWTAAQDSDDKPNNNNDDDLLLDVTDQRLDDILASCHTVIFPDSLLLSSSRIMDTNKAFVQAMVPALQCWLNHHNNKNTNNSSKQPTSSQRRIQPTLIVQCVEGLRSASAVETLNKAVGTAWKVHVLPDAAGVLADATATARRLFGPFGPAQIELDEQSQFVVSCHDNNNSNANDDDEGLFRIQVGTREDFERDFHAQDELFERLGITMDDEMDDENAKRMDCFDVEKSWQTHVEKYSDKYTAAVHGANGYHVVWYGDRGQKDGRMTFCFCKLLNLHANGVGHGGDSTNDPAAHHHHDDDYILDKDDHDPFAQLVQLVKSLPPVVWVSLLMVILAIAVQQTCMRA